MRLDDEAGVLPEFDARCEIDGRFGDYVTTHASFFSKLWYIFLTDLSLNDTACYIILALSSL